jgi:hypothetical protein
VVETVENNRTKDGDLSTEHKIDENLKQEKSRRSLIAEGTKATSLYYRADGFKRGILYDTIVAPMDRRGLFESQGLRDAAARLGVIFEPFRLDFEAAAKQTAAWALTPAVVATKPFTDRVFDFQQSITHEMFIARPVPGMSPHAGVNGKGMPLSRVSAMMTAYHFGTEGNWLRLKDGYNLQDSDRDAVMNYIGEKGMDFVQNLWNLIASFKPAIAAQDMRVRGVESKWVEAKPFMSPWGKEYAGGYVPIKVDPEVGSGNTNNLYVDDDGVEQESGRPPDEQSYHGLRNRQASRGYTDPAFKRERSKGVPKGQRARLDFGVIFEHIGEVIHDLAWAEWYDDTNRILRNAKFKDSYIRSHGRANYDVLLAHTRDIAIGDVPSIGQMQKVFDHLRRGVVINGLAFRASTMLLQPLGVFNAMPRVGPKRIIAAYSHWLKGGIEGMRAGIGEVASKSPAMEIRWGVGSTDIMRDLREMSHELMSEALLDHAFKKVPIDQIQSASDAFYIGIVKAQIMADMPVWLAGYQQAIEGGRSESDAIEIADREVVETQGSGQIKDLSQLQIKQHYKIFTPFFGFFNASQQILSESYWREKGKVVRDEQQKMEWSNLIIDYLYITTIPGYLGTLMKDALSQDYDEDEPFLSAEYHAKAALFGMAGMVSGMLLFPREILGAIGYGGGYGGPVATKSIGSMVNAGIQIKQGEFDVKATKAITEAFGIGLHFPTSTPMQGGAALIDLYLGHTNNPLEFFDGPPSSKNQSKTRARQEASQRGNWFE